MTDIKTSINRLEDYLNQKFDNIFVKFILSFNKDINFFEYPVFVDKDLIYSIDTLNTFVDDAILKIYRNLEYNFDEGEMRLIKKCIIIGSGSGKGIYAISLEKNTYGKVFLWLNDEMLDYNMSNGDTILISPSLTEFLNQLIQQNKNTAEINKLNNIYLDLKKTHSL